MLEIVKVAVALLETCVIVVVSVETDVVYSVWLELIVLVLV